MPTAHVDAVGPVVVVAYWADPCVRWATAAARVRRFVGEWRSLGVEVTLVAPDLIGVCGCTGCRRRPVDEQDVVRVRVRPSRLRALGRRAATPTVADASSDGTGGNVRSSLRALAAAREIGTTWVRPAYAATVGAVRSSAATVVVTTSGPYSSIAVGHAVRRVTGVRWVADLRDPISAPLDPTAAARSVRRVARLPLRPMLRVADARIGAAPAGATLDAAWCGAPVTTVLSGFEPFGTPDDVEPVARPPGRTLRIGLVGSLYKGFVEPDVLLDASALLPTSARAGLAIEYWGRDGALLHRLARARGVGDLVVDHGFVDRGELRRQLRRLDAVVHIPERTGTRIAGRFYDFVASGVPIAAWEPLSTVEREAVGRSGGASVDDAPALSKVLSAWSTTPPRGPGPPTADHPLSSRTQARRALAVLTAVSD